MSRIEKFAKAFQKRYYRGLCEDNEMVRMLIQDLTDKLPWLSGTDGLSTADAFLQLIGERGIHNQLQCDSRVIRVFRNEIKNGKWPKEETMADYLSRAGYMVVQEKKWVK